MQTKWFFKDDHENISDALHAWQTAEDERLAALGEEIKIGCIYAVPRGMMIEHGSVRKAASASS